MNAVPIARDVCLVGGGHSHALLLRRWAMRPLPGVRLTLVSSSAQTPYSGMLPGLIAGHYSIDDIHIDLRRLCAWAGVRFIEETITGIDLEQKHVLFADRPGISFDALSLDTGSTPDLCVPGSADHVTPVKPVSDFHSRWLSIQDRLADSNAADVSIGVVGSGAGGFELITAMGHRLRDSSARLFWFLRGNDCISGRHNSVGGLAIKAAEAAGIEVVREFDVVSVEQNKLLARDGRAFDLDEIVWCTAASGPLWPAAAGLGTDQRGFVATNAHLQSISHGFVFATGDIGTQIETPSSKAGVFAVRQAPVLFENIRRYLLSEPLKIYRPQRDFLSLMATGPKHAIASRGSLVVNGEWVWRWKDHIDQTFMDRFRQLPVLNMNASLATLPKIFSDEQQQTSLSGGHEVVTVPTAASMRCRGCGAKVGHDVLQRVLDDLLPDGAMSDGLSSAGLHDNAPSDGVDLTTTMRWSPAGDTAVIDLPGKRLVQSVDQINAIVDDPYLLGRIAALHAMSDVMTLNCNVHSAQVLLTLPEASEAVVERDLRLLMSGILSALNEESCLLVGGHTAQGPDMSVGLTINASMVGADEAELVTTPLVTPGDALIMTKALGVGTLFVGLMRGDAHGVDITSAIDSMLTSNRAAADILRSHGCAGMTDITGFGLLGHMLRLLSGLHFDVQQGGVEDRQPGAALGLDSITLISGALSLSRQGCRSSLWPQNSQVFADITIDGQCEPAHSALLVDPQTSGGLLGVVPRAEYPSCIAALAAAGCAQACLIGFIEPSSSIHIAPTLEMP